ncbi:MAG: GNAT family N-acetyltransferase [Bacteroidales bacterium]|nr:GNAT family N-acetyltransferase [Bacteroidales bacterium]MCM1416464.1 GNAT family N-acetyltransferase [bacterium]MCM1424520.1 GNAT family N-acetyltransferase [bacterium]
MNGEKVYLRPITAADTEQIVAWRNQDFVRKNFIYQKPFTKEGHETWLREQVEPGHVAQFIICVESGGTEKIDPSSQPEEMQRAWEIGSVYLRDIDRQKKTAEYGIFIGEKKALGRGYGTQAARLMTDYGFEQLGLEKIFLRLLADNVRARKSYEKAGFRLVEDRQETAALEQGVQAVIFMECDRSQWKEQGKGLGK